MMCSTSVSATDSIADGGRFQGKDDEVRDPQDGGEDAGVLVTSGCVHENDVVVVEASQSDDVVRVDVCGEVEGKLLPRPLSPAGRGLLRVDIDDEHPVRSGERGREVHDGGGLAHTALFRLQTPMILTTGLLGRAACDQGLRQ